MKWVTRKGVKFDRSACAWLILRKLDPQAEFGFLEAEEMPGAIAAGAKPFHDVTYKGPGSRERTSFEELVLQYLPQHNDPALDLMRDFIHRAEIEGEASGIDDPLRAIAKGVNALVKSDQEMIDRMLPIYDALYAYCQRRAAGRNLWASLEPDWGK
jgi:hypothetical protein